MDDKNQINDDIKRLNDLISMYKEELGEKEAIIDDKNDEEYLDNYQILDRLNPDDMQINYLKRLTVDNLKMYKKITIGNLLNFFNTNNKGVIYHPRSGNYYSTTNKIVRNRNFLIEAIYNYIDKLGIREEELARSSIKCITYLRKKIEKLEAQLYYKNIILEAMSTYNIKHNIKIDI